MGIADGTGRDEHDVGRSKGCGVGEEQLAAVCDEIPLEALAKRERTIIEWADRYVLDPAGITDELVARVLDHLRDDQMVELALVIGATQMLNHFCTAFDVPPAA